MTGVCDCGAVVSTGMGFVSSGVGGCVGCVAVSLLFYSGVRMRRVLCECVPVSVCLLVCVE